MAYNNFYPGGYQPQFYPVNTQMQNAQVSQAMSGSPNNGIIWIQGEAGAKSYLVAPNTTVQLWDSESPTIYLKSADASGMPSIKTLDYTIREKAQATESHKNASKVEFVTRDEFEALKSKIEALTAMPKKSPAKKSEVKDDAE